MKDNEDPYKAVQSDIQGFLLLIIRGRWFDPSWAHRLAADYGCLFHFCRGSSQPCRLAPSLSRHTMSGLNSRSWSQLGPQ